jgi:hypothetical protein
MSTDIIFNQINFYFQCFYLQYFFFNIKIVTKHKYLNVNFQYIEVNLIVT